MATVYRSKADTWLVAVLVMAIITSLFAAIKVLSAGFPGAWAVAAFIAIMGAGLPLWLLFSTRYTLGRSQLVVQSGPFKWRIPVADITSVTPSNNPLSSPALSLDRLRIDYGRSNSLMISPKTRMSLSETSRLPVVVRPKTRKSRGTRTQQSCAGV